MKASIKFNLYYFGLLAWMILTLNTSHAQNFIKITTGSLVNEPGDSWGCSWADYDNDGKLDLFIANAVNDFLYRGTGDSIFIKITAGQIINDSLDTRGSAWGDYDNDGDEDLFISIGAGNNILYRNDGNGNLTRITTQVLSLMTAVLQEGARGEITIMTGDWICTLQTLVMISFIIMMGTVILQK